MRSHTILVTPPTYLPVSVSEVKTTGRIQQNVTDADIDDWIRALTEVAQHKIRRRLLNAGMRTYFDHFPWCGQLDASPALVLPWGPLVSVAAVKYLDSNGAEQTLDTATYWVDVASLLGRVVLAPSRSWPTTQYRERAVWVDYTAGYGATPSAVPRPVRRWIIARALSHDSARETLSDRQIIELPYDYVDGLLDQYIVQVL